ncbi:MAG: undecaprenyl-diphosphate phosphatase [Polyangiaceae bacterium]
MELWLAAVLGVLEGLTEYLPVSSTGHLIVAERFLGTKNDAFDIVVQFGAILAVLVHYRELLAGHAKGLVRREPASMTLLLALVVGFVPTAISGLLFRKAIKAHLFNPTTVACALFVGGIVMIVVERVRASKAITGEDGLEHVTLKRAAIIGLGQCVSMIPGSSRSMCTILAGQFTGLSTKTAAEFSFLLGLPTLGAATMYEAYKSRKELFAPGQISALAVGLVVSFFVAWAVIASFVRYLGKRGLEPFGAYRIVLALVVFAVLVR